MISILGQKKNNENSDTDLNENEKKKKELSNRQIHCCIKYQHKKTRINDDDWKKITKNSFLIANFH